jgi:hypothetical protein
LRFKITLSGENEVSEKYFDFRAVVKYFVESILEGLRVHSSAFSVPRTRIAVNLSKYLIEYGMVWWLVFFWFNEYPLDNGVDKEFAPLFEC